jgi:hypothetical protein
MDLVYICRDGENEELRYSIRSAVKNIPHDKIWVVGGKPDWYTGPHIPVKQSATKYLNVARNLQAAFNSELISEDIVLMNDDFFIIKPIDEIKTYHNGPLFDVVKGFRSSGVNSKYVKKLDKTRMVLKGLYGIRYAISYELHIPMRVTKSGMQEVIQLGIASRSAYGNIYGVGGEHIEDVKFYLGDLMDHKNYKQILEYEGNLDSVEYPYLSSSDDSFPVLLETILGDLFPEPSPYEDQSIDNND